MIFSAFSSSPLSLPSWLRRSIARRWIGEKTRHAHICGQPYCSDLYLARFYTWLEPAPGWRVFASDFLQRTNLTWFNRPWIKLGLWNLCWLATHTQKKTRTKLLGGHNNGRFNFHSANGHEKMPCFVSIRTSIHGTEDKITCIILSYQVFLKVLWLHRINLTWVRSPEVQIKPSYGYCFNTEFPHEKSASFTMLPSTRQNGKKISYFGLKFKVPKEKANDTRTTLGFFLYEKGSKNT